MNCYTSNFFLKTQESVRPERNTIDFDYHHKDESTAYNVFSTEPCVINATGHNAQVQSIILNAPHHHYSGSTA